MNNFFTQGTKRFRILMLCFLTLLSLPALSTRTKHPPTPTKTLGTGASATTYEAQYNGTSVAYKKLRASDKNLVRKLKNERKILKKLNNKGGHPQVVQLFGYVKGPELGLILELMEGDLTQFVYDGLVAPNDWHNLLTQVFLGLVHVHANNIVLCDLKPDNILCRRNNGLLHFKLADFGLASPPQSGKKQMRTRSMPGSLSYMAPEVFYLAGFDCKADMWSLGIIIATTLAGFDLDEVVAPIDASSTNLDSPDDSFRFMDTFFQEAYDRGHIAKDLYEGPYLELVKKLCELEPTKRWSARRALKKLRQMNPEDFVTFYFAGPEPEAKAIIGEGGTAVIYLADWMGHDVAYKVLRTGASKQSFERELAVLLTLHQGRSHPNILQLISYVDQPNRQGLVLELMHCDLFDAMERHLVDANDWRDIMVQVFLGLAHVHGFGLVYGDLKPENILCKIHDNLVDIKLSDFGTTVPPQGPGNPMIGSLEFIAPEVFLGNGFDEKADMWSAGILLSELFGMNPQIPANTISWGDLEREMQKKYLRIFFRAAQESAIKGSPSLTGRYLLLFYQLCSFDPKHRPSAQDAAKRVSTFQACTTMPHKL